MTPAHQAAVVQFYIGKIDEAAFLKAYGVGREKMKNEVDIQMARATAEQDAEILEHVFLLGYKFGFPSDCLDRYQDLLGQAWHRQHEDMIGYLQKLRDPGSVNALQEAIALKPRLDYLAYDDYGAYYKKCLWALQAIGTEQAIAAIRECALGQDPVLQNEATYRLAKIGAAPEMP